MLTGLAVSVIKQKFGGTHISRNEIEAILTDAGQKIRLDKKEAYNTIKSGLDAGESHPKTNISSQNTHEYISENKKIKPIKIESFCVGHFLNDSSPMPEDIYSFFFCYNIHLHYIQLL